MWEQNIAFPSSLTTTLHAREDAKMKFKVKVTGNPFHFGQQKPTSVPVLRLLVPVTEPGCHPSPVDQGDKGSQWLCLHSTDGESCAWFTASAPYTGSIWSSVPHQKSGCWVDEALPLLWNLSGVREETIRNRSSIRGFAWIGGNTMTLHGSDWWEENETRKWWKGNTHLFSIPCIEFLERGLQFIL